MLISIDVFRPQDASLKVCDARIVQFCNRVSAVCLVRRVFTKQESRNGFVVACNIDANKMTMFSLLAQTFLPLSTPPLVLSYAQPSLPRFASKPAVIPMLVLASHIRSLLALTPPPLPPPLVTLFAPTFAPTPLPMNSTYCLRHPRDLLCRSLCRLPSCCNL